MKPCERCDGRGEVPTGDDLRSIREGLGLTLVAFSEACGWSFGHQDDMERDRRNITPKTWRKAQEIGGRRAAK